MTISAAEVCAKLSSGSFESRFLYFMRLSGIEKVEVEYSGGGDSGSIENVVVHSKNMNEETRTTLESDFLNDRYDSEIGHYIWEKHGSFADGGGYHVSGKVVYSVGETETEDSIDLVGTDYTTEYGEWNEEIEDYDSEEESEEDWEEHCWSREEGEVYTGLGSMWGSNKRKNDLSLLIRYATAKYDEVPEEIHNVILTSATMGDDAGKEYIKNKK